MRQKKNRIVLVASLALLGYTGCATADIIKDTGGDLHGLRFYLPRPYIVVLKPFPVAQNSWVLPGKVTSDGVLVSASDVNATPLKGMIFTGSAVSAAPFLLFQKPTGGENITATAGAGGGALPAQAGSEAEGVLSKSQVDSLADQLLRAGVDVDLDNAATGGSATAWIKKGDITEMRDPVNDLFEIRYLPDLEERYVLVGEARLGSASIDAYLTSGWLAHHYGKTVDRKGLGKMVFGNVQAVLDIARAAGKTALIASTGGVGAIPVAAEEIAATSGGGGARDCLLQFTVVEQAVPGLYPILKKEELKDGRGYELKIPDSFQQPSNLALRVGYRTTKTLIISVARDGSVEPPKPPDNDEKVTFQSVKEEIEDLLSSVASDQQPQVPIEQVNLQVRRGTGDYLAEVNLTRAPSFSGDAAQWEDLFNSFAKALADPTTFPYAAKVRLQQPSPSTGTDPGAGGGGAAGDGGGQDGQPGHDQEAPLSPPPVTDDGPGMH